MKKKLLFVSVLFLIGIQLIQAQNAIYVNSTASGSNNGSDWVNAFTDLQSAVSLAVAGDEIWVASGTYKPTSSTDRNISFVMKNGVGIYGGFGGIETVLTERDWAANETILSGDIGTSDDRSDNSLHVVANINNGLNSTAVLDGFTITKGNANINSGNNHEGGGIINVSSSVTITNCKLIDNFKWWGRSENSGIANINSSPIISSCDFFGPKATGSSGEGMYNMGGAPQVSNCSFDDGSVVNKNSTPHFSSSNFINGSFFSNDNCLSIVESCSFTLNSGMINNNSDPMVTNCVFSNNHGFFTGSAMSNNTSSPTVVNSVFNNNSARNWGGAVSNISSSFPKFINCTFWGNTSPYINSFMSNSAFSSADLENCIIWGDSSNIVALDAQSGAQIRNSIVMGGCPADVFCPSGVFTFNPLFVDPAAGDFRLQVGSPAVDKGNDEANSTILDVDGQLRMFDAIPGGSQIDLGAYEQNAIDADRWYVNASASPGPGYTWATAFKTLQRALDVANAGDEIWVAEGSYFPTKDVNGNSGSFISKTFVMINGVSIYGGFANIGSPDFIDRNPANNLTILNGNGVGRTITNNGLDNTAVLDGFTVTGGNIAANGGGMLNNNSSPIINNCRFINNTSATDGGGMHNQDGAAPILTNCEFFGNNATKGSAVNNVSASATFTNCSFGGNTSTGGFPSVMYSSLSSVMVANCIFWGNTSGIVNDTSPDATYANSIIQGGCPIESTCTDVSDVNPYFFDLLGGDLRLISCSPAINVGDNSFISSGATTDLDNNSRIFNTTVDMGCYEFQSQPTPQLTINCPSSITVNTDEGLCTASGFALGNPTSGNCFNETISNDAPTNFPLGQTIVTWTLTNGIGATTTCEQTITVSESIPKITCPSDITVNADLNASTASGVDLGIPITFGCNVVEVTNNAPADFPVGSTNVIWTVTTAMGKTANCTQVVTVMDVQPPTISCAEDIFVNDCETVVDYDLPLIGDNCPILKEVVFNNIAAEQLFIVPPGVTSVNIKAWGASGQGPSGARGGYGGFAEGDLPVTPGETLYIYCGGTGGFNGGGSPTAGDGSGGGGSDIRQGGNGLNERVIVAGGGGGGCSFETYIFGGYHTWNKLGGAGGGLTGSSGQNGAAGGTQTAGGGNGSFGQGGSGNQGGGGGWYGGGAGCAAGGGSSYIDGVTSGNTIGGQRNGHGVIKIMYVPTTANVQTAGLPPGSIFPFGTTTNTFEVTDNAGNTSSCSFDVTVNYTDTEPPVITCPATITINNDTGLCSASGVSLGSATAIDNCSQPFIVITNDAPTVFPLGLTIVIWTATDESGNTAYCSQEVQVNDEEIPTITCPAIAIIDNDLGLCTASNVDLETPATNDNCGVATVINNAPAVFPMGSTLVLWTVTDESGNQNSCSQEVIVRDTENPTIICPAAVTIAAATGFCEVGNVDLGSPLTGDNCPGETVANDAPVSFPLGTTEVTWTVTDLAGNNTSCVQLITVNYLVAPSFVLPDDIIEDNADCGNAVINYTDPYLINDYCSSLNEIIFNHTGANQTWVVPEGVNSVIIKARGASGGGSNGGNGGYTEGSLSVTSGQILNIYVGGTGSIGTRSFFGTTNGTGGYNGGGAPSSGSGSSVANAGGGGASDVRIGTNSLNDRIIVAAGGGGQAIVQNGSGGFGTTYSYYRGGFGGGLIGGTGENGSAGGTQSTPGGNASFGNGGNATSTGAGGGGGWYGGGAGNAAGGGSSYIGGVSDGITNEGVNTGDGSVIISYRYTATEGNQTAGLPSGSIFPAGKTINTFEAVDAAGNLSTCSFSVMVVYSDVCNQPPVAVCQDITVSAGPNCEAFIKASDVDGGSSDPNSDFLTLSLENTGPFGVGIHQVILIVTDPSGETDQCAASVTVVDDIDPTAVAQNVIVQLDPNGIGSTTASLVDDGSFDNCGPVTLSASTTAFSCADLGANNVTLTVVDGSGNSSDALAVVTVIDAVLPSAVVNNITIYLDGSGSANIVAADIDGGSIDNCGPVTLSASTTAFSCADLGANNVTLTVVDGSGNSSDALAVVTVIDAVLPSAVVNNITIYLDGSGSANIVAADIDGGSFDNCGPVTLSASTTAFSCADLGANNVTLTVVDGSGNSSDALAVVTVIDAVLPSAVVNNITINLDGLGSANIVAADIDGGSIDNCGPVTLSASTTTFSCADLGANNVTLTVVDGSGNSSDALAVVTVIDAVLPSAVVNNITINLDGSGSANIVAADIDGGSIDNCGPVTLSASTTTFSCADLGANHVTLTVVDGSGNSSDALAVVTVIDAVLPNAVVNNITIYLDDSGSANIVAADIDNGSKDACGIKSLVLSQTAFDCSNVGTPVEVTLTVTDNNNNVSTTTAIVTVEDNVAPGFITCPSDFTVTLSRGNCEAVVTYAMPTGMDNCSGFSIQQIAGLGSGAVYKMGPSVETFRITDASGNTNSCSFTIMVDGDQKDNDGDGVSNGCDVCPGQDDLLDTDDDGVPDCLDQCPGFDDFLDTNNNGIPDGCDTCIGSVLSADAGLCQVVYLGYKPFECTVLNVVATGGEAPYSYKWSDNKSGITTRVCPTATTTYTVTVTDNNGCQTTSQVTVEVVDVRCGTKDKDVELCYNGNTLCINKKDVDSYLNEGAVLGNCSVLTCATAGNPSSAQAKTKLAISITDASVQPSEFDFKMYPNPTKGVVYLKVSSSESMNSEVIVQSVTGSEVFRKRYKATEEIAIDLSKHAKGTYLITLRIGDKLLYKKLILDSN